MEKTLNDWTRAELEALPFRENWTETSEPFDSLIILPTEDIHDSNFRCMDFIAARGDVPLYRCSGGSDVLHIDGIGGPRDKELDKAWSIDCLRGSGLLRLFVVGKSSDRLSLRAGAPISSFEIFAESQKPSVCRPETLDQFLSAVEDLAKQNQETLLEKMGQIAKPLRDTQDSSLKHARRWLTQEKAKVVRRIRVEQGYAWSEVAETCHRLFNGDWFPVSNQLMGMALCEVAAEFFNEHYQEEPWN